MPMKWHKLMRTTKCVFVLWIFPWENRTHHPDVIYLLSFMLAMYLISTEVPSQLSALAPMPLVLLVSAHMTSAKKFFLIHLPGYDSWSLKCVRLPKYFTL